MKKKYVLKNERRFAFFIVLIIMITFSAGMIVHAGAASHSQVNYETVRVDKGDTLWEIASEHAANSDPRAYIYEIKELNKLAGDIIYEGQELYLPE